LGGLWGYSPERALWAEANQERHQKLAAALSMAAGGRKDVKIIMF
jgi:hypothetical protein